MEGVHPQAALHIGTGARDGGGGRHHSFERFLSPKTLPKTEGRTMQPEYLFCFCCCNLKSPQKVLRWFKNCSQAVATRRHHHNLEMFFFILRLKESPLSARNSAGPCGMNNGHATYMLLQYAVRRKPHLSLDFAMRSVVRPNSATMSVDASRTQPNKGGPRGAPTQSNIYHRPGLHGWSCGLSEGMIQQAGGHPEV